MKVAFLLFTLRLRLLLGASALVREWMDPAPAFPPSARPLPGFTPERIVWAVAAAGRYIPGGKGCLLQALAARILFASYGFPARLRVGVAKGWEDPFRAHAWMEGADGELIFPATETSPYRPLA